MLHTANCQASLASSSQSNLLANTETFGLLCQTRGLLFAGEATAAAVPLLELTLKFNDNFRVTVPVPSWKVDRHSFREVLMAGFSRFLGFIFS